MASSNTPQTKGPNTTTTRTGKFEAAKFHAIFFADLLGGYDVYKGPADLEPTICCIASPPWLPPTPWPANPRPSNRLSNGRVAWNIVTSYLDSAARNFGLDTQVEHDERYDIAHEYLDVTYKLWEGSLER
ncbi:luciferase-like domain-containing protein [Leptodontidium sp. MPI-SDFR-AT-0119]|nr:luciferase-like domain-containing protein [Leptodontidium sp. MPI-SDFR-AT-0119]